MAEPLAQERWTIADLDRFPDDEWHRYEIIDGELFVSKATRGEHSWSADECVGAFKNWDPERQHGFVFSVPGLIFSEFDAVIPDVIWVSRERFPQIWHQEDGKFHAAPDLVIEVLSPGARNEQRDRETKLGLYSTWGVREYWIVDWQAETVSVYRRRGVRLRLAATLGHDDTLTSPLLPGFALPVARLVFRQP